MNKYRTRIEIGSLDGMPFLDIFFVDSPLPYPASYRRFVVPVVHEPLNIYRENGDVDLFLDFSRAIVPGTIRFEEIYYCRTKQAVLLRDLEAAAYDRMQDALTCNPDLFGKVEELVFESSAGLDNSPNGIPEDLRRLRGKPGPRRHKGIGEE